MNIAQPGPRFVAGRGIFWTSLRPGRLRKMRVRMFSDSFSYPVNRLRGGGGPMVDVSHKALVSLCRFVREGQEAQRQLTRHEMRAFADLSPQRVLRLRRPSFTFTPQRRFAATRPARRVRRGAIRTGARSDPHLAASDDDPLAPAPPGRRRWRTKLPRERRAMPAGERADRRPVAIVRFPPALTERLTASAMADVSGRSEIGDTLGTSRQAVEQRWPRGRGSRDRWT